MNRLLDPAPDHALSAAHPSSHWYAISTYSRHEKTVKAYLDTKAIEAFLPTVTVQSRWKDRNVELTLPAFPGYVFVRISMQECGRVLSTPGVARILSFNRAPAPIHHMEIDALRLCVERCRSAVESHHFLEVGERVRVRAGILQGVEGLITRKKGACRLILSIALIHQSVAVDIDGSLLEILPAVPREGTSEMKAAGSIDSYRQPVAQSDTELPLHSLSLLRTYTSAQTRGEQLLPRDDFTDRQRAIDHRQLRRKRDEICSDYAGSRRG
jgi:transcription antitermination factor NusG